MSIISPIQSHYHEGSPMSKKENLRWEGFVGKVGSTEPALLFSLDSNKQ